MRERSHALKEKDCNTTVNDANGLFHATTSYQFIVCLITVSRCLEKTHPLTKQLESSIFDIVAATEKVSL